MHDMGLGQVDDTAAGARKPPAPVRLLAVHKIALIHKPNLLYCGAADKQTRAPNPIDLEWSQSAESLDTQQRWITTIHPAIVETPELAPDRREPGPRRLE